MNQRKAKALKKVAKLLAVRAIQRLLPEEEAQKVNTKSIVEFEKTIEPTYYDGEKIRLSPNTVRYFYKQLKRGG